MPYPPKYIRTLAISITCLLGCTGVVSAQSLRIEDMKKNFSKEEWFKASGGVKAEGSYYAADPNYGRLKKRKENTQNAFKYLLQNGK